MDYEIIGYMAGVCMAIAQFPQAWMVWKTKDTRGISLLMFTILTLGVALWFLFGLINGVVSMWLTNGICLIPSLYILIVAYRNRFRG